MSKLKFFRKYKRIIHCQVCGVRIAQKKYNLKYCDAHLKEYEAILFRKIREYQERPENKKKFAAYRYQTWLKWVENNKEKRRAQALASYHRKKKLKTKTTKTKKIKNRAV